MAIQLSAVKEARTDEVFTVLVPVNVSVNGNGTTEAATIEVKYRAVTEEVMNLPRVSQQLAAIVEDLGLEEDGVKIAPTIENLKDFPMPFLGLIMQEIVGDYFPKFQTSPGSRPGIRKAAS